MLYWLGPDSPASPTRLSCWDWVRVGAIFWAVNLVLTMAWSRVWEILMMATK